MVILTLVVSWIEFLFQDLTYGRYVSLLLALLLFMHSVLKTNNRRYM